MFHVGPKFDVGGQQKTSIEQIVALLSCVIVSVCLHDLVK